MEKGVSVARSAAASDCVVPLLGLSVSFQTRCLFQSQKHFGFFLRLESKNDVTCSLKSTSSPALIVPRVLNSLIYRKCVLKHAVQGLSPL